MGHAVIQKVYSLNDVYLYSEKYGAQFYSNTSLNIYMNESFGRGDLVNGSLRVNFKTYFLQPANIC